MRPALVLLALLAAAGDAAAASFTLTDATRHEAIRVGERSTTTEGFDREWRVGNAAGERAMVVTPFHRVAIVARHAAFKQSVLKPADIDKALKAQAGRLVVWVELRGRRPDFAQYYVPRLLAGEREIKAAFVQNERTAARQEDGGYVARCVYGFPIPDVDPRGRVALVVADTDGRDVSRFTIDLSGMR